MELCHLGCSAVERESTTERRAQLPRTGELSVELCHLGCGAVGRKPTTHGKESVVLRVGEGAELGRG